MKHYLLVTEELDHIVEHSSDCPTEEHEHPFNEFPMIIEWTCNLGKYEGDWGLIDLEEDDRYDIPGRYEIDFYHYWSGSMFDDAEAYIYFV